MLPCPWDSPGKNTGVGCHFPLQCMKVKSEREVAQLCLTPSDPMDCSPPGSSDHGICQARGLEWGAIALSGYDSLVACKSQQNYVKGHTPNWRERLLLEYKWDHRLELQGKTTLNVFFQFFIRIYKHIHVLLMQQNAWSKNRILHWKYIKLHSSYFHTMHYPSEFGTRYLPFLCLSSSLEEYVWLCSPHKVTVSQRSARALVCHKSSSLPLCVLYCVSVREIL